MSNGLSQIDQKSQHDWQQLVSDWSLEFHNLKARWETLKTERDSLARENDALRAALGDIASRHQEPLASFVSRNGVLWRVVPGRAADGTAYCPNCRLPLLTYPPESGRILFCWKCAFVPSELRPLDIRTVASEIIG